MSSPDLSARPRASRGLSFQPAFRNRYLFLLDVVLLPFALFLAMDARFEGSRWVEPYGGALVATIGIALPLSLTILFSLGLYRRLWRFASISDLEVLGIGSLLVAAVTAAVGLVVVPFADLPRLPFGVLAINIAFVSAMLTVPRLAVRIIARRLRRSAHRDQRPVLIAGAGQAGAMIAVALIENPQWGIVPVGFVDDDAGKQRLRLHGLPVLGTTADLAKVAQKIDATELVIAIPSAPGRVLRDIVTRAREAGLTTRTVPGVFEILTGRTAISELRKVEIQDLLRRDHVDCGTEELQPLVSGRVVLVTGAGGSIGSELCRQIAQVDPILLVILGRGENSIFEIQQELAERYPSVSVQAVIADVRDQARIEQVFEHFRPAIVFHAAAHKHVPLMEQHIGEAIINNVRGTRNVATMAAKYGAERFVLISTDKAVRPTSIMGATKRIAEQVVLAVATRESLPYAAVRFGNVLGSRGSVVPTFMKQIAAGGPVTVTDAEMTRYFMTIPEAVHLVLQASVLAEGGEVFVLDMGEPVKIVDLARDLIRLSGLEEGVDVEIKFTGLRPGEKLYEELFFDDSNATRTRHPAVLRAREQAVGRNPGLEQIDALIAAAEANTSPRELRRMIRELVPDYQGQRDSQELQVQPGGIKIGGARPAAVVAGQTNVGKSPAAVVKR